MKLMIAALLLAAPLALADDKPLVQNNTRTFYNYAERHAWSPVDLPVTDALATVDTERDYDVTVRNFYLVPVVGGELSTVGGTFRRAANGTVVGSTQTSEVYGAPAFGALLGWRLGAFNVGARYQGAIYTDSDLDRLMLNKVYGEIGLNARKGRALFSGYLDLGYAFATSRNSPLRNGFGGKAGVAVDFLVARSFSFGPALEFDVQALNTDPTWVAIYGGSALLRLGIHL